MSYDTVKTAIKLRLQELGYQESSQAVDFENAPANEYGDRFILKCLTGANQIDSIVDRFHDLQEWQILIAFARSEHNDIIMMDSAQRSKDLIIKDLDKPANWAGSVKILQYDTWTLEEFDNYFVMDIRLSIMDLYIHG